MCVCAFDRPATRAMIAPLSLTRRAQGLGTLGTLGFGNPRVLYDAMCLCVFVQVAVMDAAKAKHREESKLRAQYNKNPLAAKEKGTNPRRSGRALEWMRALDCGILGQGERALE